jgi:hypothetical protein
MCLNLNQPISAKVTAACSNLPDDVCFGGITVAASGGTKDGGMLGWRVLLAVVALIELTVCIVYRCCCSVLGVGTFK